MYLYPNTCAPRVKELAETVRQYVGVPVLEWSSRQIRGRRCCLARLSRNFAILSGIVYLVMSLVKFSAT